MYVNGKDIPMGGGGCPDGTRITLWDFGSSQVFVLVAATGEVTYVATGAGPVWLDDHTLILERTG